MKPLLLILFLMTSTFAQQRYEALFDTQSIFEKKEIWHTLTNDDKNEARRIHYAWGIHYLKLGDEQTEFLDRFVVALDKLTKEQQNAFRDEALKLFTPEQNALLFGSIGPYKKCTPNIVSFNQPANCPCSVGSSFNLSCDGDCTGAGGRCTTTGDGCGFAWLYSCNGFCSQN